MSLLTEEEQDRCMPSDEQLEAYLAEPDDAVAAALTEKDKRLVAKFILLGRNVADASQTKTLKAVAEWLDKPCLSGTEDAIYKCPRCVRQLRDMLREGKMPGEE
ncbi:hypothetical protein LCGC14_0513700 [marine sediment metagenome]|uniref:Uncharacterized protein n=1 Tax=marine sediment metagenome TaxID=412755 RepID=A0A0F9V8R2_9ZZZZ